MNIQNILKAAGATALSVAFPAAAPAVLAMVNTFLSEEDKLPETATGAEVESKLGKLPPDLQQTIYLKEIELDKVIVEEKYSTLRTMLEHDSRSQHTTRPKIAYQSFQVIGASILMVAASTCVQIVQGEVNPLDAGTLILALTAPLAIILRAYFGILRDERASLHTVADGKPRDFGLLSKLLKGR